MSISPAYKTSVIWVGIRHTLPKKRVRWGMLYRSAQIDSLECYSRRELKNIGIKTIIDLRSESELKGHTPLQQGFNVIHVPIKTGDMEDILKGIQEQKIKATPSTGWWSG